MSRTRDFADRGGGKEIVGEAGCFVHQLAIRGVGIAAQLFHDAVILRHGAVRAVMVQQRGFHGRGEQRLQIAAADFRVGIFARDHFALFCDAYLPVHAARRLRQDRVVTGAAAATDSAAASVKQAQFDAVFREHFHQFDFCLVQLPVCSEIAAVLVAVGVAQHHFLRVAAAEQQLAIPRNGKQLVHDDSAAAQVFDGFEQRDDVDMQRVAALQQA